MEENSLKKTHLAVTSQRPTSKEPRFPSCSPCPVYPSAPRPLRAWSRRLTATATRVAWEAPVSPSPPPHPPSLGKASAGRRGGCHWAAGPRCPLSQGLRSKAGWPHQCASFATGRPRSESGPTFTGQHEGRVCRARGQHGNVTWARG